MISYKNLPLEIKRAIKKEFPQGIEEEIQSIKNVITGTYFDGIIFPFDGKNYLIKMNTETNIFDLPLDIEAESFDMNFDEE
jgi:hypothetical protein